MRLQLAPGDRKVLLIAAGVFVILLLMSFYIGHGANADQDIPSAYSTASRGCKAAFLLLQESGYRTQTWERSLAELPAGSGVTLVLAEPTGYPGKEEKESLKTFLRSGGRVVAAGRFVGFYLPEDDESPNAMPGSTWVRVSALSPSRITRAAPEISLIPRAYWKSSTTAVGLYGESDRPSVVAYTVGKGEVLWLADPTPLTNAGLKETGNMEFLLSAVGDPNDSRVLWDEYIHGFERSVMSKKSWGLVGWISLQLAIFGVAILATYSRRNGPMFIPASENRLSPLEFVRTLGSLYEHANAGSVAVEISYQRFRYLLTRRLGLAMNSTVADLDRALRQRGVLDDRHFAETLTTCESCRYDARVPRATALKLVQALADYAARLKLIRPHSKRKKEREKNAWKP